jgi:hypothetical protein
MNQIRSPRSLHRRPAHGRARRLIHAGRRGLLDNLLVPALQGAIPLEQVHHLAMAVAKHLHLDMARAGHVLLDQHAIIAEAGRRLALAARQQLVEVGRGLDLAHALAPAAGDRLDQHRISDRLRFLRKALRRLVLAQVTRRHRHARRRHQRLGRVLETHRLDRLGGRSDPDKTLRLHGPGERRILRQESIARMDRLGPGRLRRGKDLLRYQITLPGGRRTDQHRLIRLPHEGQPCIRLRIDRHGPDMHAPAGADDATGDLAPVGDEKRCDHSA